MREREIIDQVFAPLAEMSGAYGLQDDCAAIAPMPGQDWVITTDPIRQGVHFLDDAPEDLAWKALAVNVSDLAGKGARPVAYVLAVSFPEMPDAAWLGRLGAGLRAAQDAFGLSLIGGDTDRAPGPVSLAATVMGEVPRGRMVRQSGARPDDLIYVSGELGWSAVGLQVRLAEDGDGDAADVIFDLSDTARAAAVARYLRPVARTGLRAALRRAATAATDISDGFLKNMRAIADASGCAAEVDLARLPIADPVGHVRRAADAQMQLALGHGDDFEVIATVAERDAGDFEALAAAGGVAVACVGRCTDGSGLTIRDASGNAKRFVGGGHDHF